MKAEVEKYKFTISWGYKIKHEAWSYEQLPHLYPWYKCPLRSNGRYF